MDESIEEFDIPGYVEVCRKDRPFLHIGGGVAIYRKFDVECVVSLG